MYKFSTDANTDGLLWGSSLLMLTF